jgi:alpha-1,2-mannosyltransferase
LDSRRRRAEAAPTLPPHSGSEPDHDGEPVWTPRRGSDWAAILGIVVLGFLVRAVPVLRGAGLQGYLGYDDGVYFASASALVDGVLPYRDFLLLHPPGITLLLSPFALLGAATDDSTGFAAARLAFMMLGAFNAGLVALVAGRYGRRAALFAGVLYAVWYAATRVEQTTLLIGPETTFLLIGFIILGSRQPLGLRRAIAAGAIFGLSVAVQIWQVAPMMIVLGWFSPSWRGAPGGWRRPTIGFLAAAAGALAIVCLPFIVQAPGALIRYVLLDQLARPTNGISLVTRLRGLEALPPSTHFARELDAVAVALAFIGIGAAVVVARRVPAARVWCALVVVETAYLLAAPIFITHYSGWVAPAAAIVLGTAASILIDGLDPHRPLGVAARATSIVVIAAIAFVTIPRHQGTTLERDALEADVRLAGCVSADAASLLLETTAMRSDLIDRCPLVLDPTGTSYDTDRGRLASGPVGPSRNLALGYQSAMVRNYGDAGAAMFIRLGSDGLTPASMSAIADRLPLVEQHGDVTDWLRPGMGR